MEYILSIVSGISLAAACGFRVFVPLLILSIASMSGLSELTTDEQWIASTPALITFAVATIFEIIAYYVPWLDNIFDTIATPLAAVAGVLTMSTLLTDVNPILGWTLAVITGGGAAISVQLLTVKGRAISSGITAGFGNFILSTGELVLSVFVSVIAIILPVIALLIVLIVIFFIVRRIYSSRNKVTSVV
ncbi:MAG: DUF4126 domain-containing protein [Ignavibacteriaceae bacterium]|jgi:hypothetical protein|nr:MAG: DUF4126 domain-containing protein [Chlorobiota bacterium]KXK01615.1 MAG: hypothetical protein UZ04_CHB001002185 [Chlorobi bacterium OLB4]MBV6398639.1 hypothetical protein [Ignavibacteria bacterium]MCC6885193.1 DUF4126 domain-containing protein [Ignavibacteriales bacterium]MCE7952017.1 DUF4126 domain-containing protein [Chlorobi bacterium CHB7]MDL1886425.1 DUF4126 domain-containing protein [Ignavibacteria bacterium CHB1]MEB2330421.1 DUF4126 domain-containing protein [Ignavibacteriaceae